MQRHDDRQSLAAVCRPRRAKRLVSRAALLLAAAACLVVSARAVTAQSGGSYDLTWSTIDAGGATFSTSGTDRLGGTAGQPDAGTLSSGAYVLAGGLWAGALPLLTPTPTNTATPTATRTPTRTFMASPSFTPTRTPTRTPTATVPPPLTVTRSRTPTQTPTATRTATPTRTPTPTSISPGCVGDCGHDGAVAVDELITMVNIALGHLLPSDCELGDADHDGEITINEIVTAVNNALNGCGEVETVASNQ